MAWTDPRDWTAGELVTASIVNTHIRDNLNALKAPPTDQYEINEASDYTTTSTTFVDVDSTDLTLSITTTGGDVLCVFFGAVDFSAGTNGPVYFDITMDGTRMAGDDGMLEAHVSSQEFPFCIVHLERNVSAGAHTFALQWKVGSGANTARLFAGAGTSNFDLHPEFWVREVS